MRDSSWIREFTGVSNAELHDKYIHDKEQIETVLGRSVVGEVVSKDTMKELYRTDKDLALHFDRTLGHIAQRMIDKMYKT